MKSKYMTLEKYAATLKVGDEVTIEYHSMAGDRQTIEKILKITKSGTIYLRSTNCKDAIRFRKNGQWLDNFSYQDEYSSLKKPLPSTVGGDIALLTGGSYILSATFGRKNFLTILKNKEIVRTMIKKERERQIKKAYIFYRRRVKTLLATGRYLLTIDYRKKDINNEK